MELNYCTKKVFEYKTEYDVVSGYELCKETYNTMLSLNAYIANSIKNIEKYEPNDTFEALLNWDSTILEFVSHHFQSIIHKNLWLSDVVFIGGIMILYEVDSNKISNELYANSKRNEEY